jgi:hypothetical protein
VTITRGPRRSTEALLSTVGSRLWDEAWDGCYSEPELRALAAKRFSGRTLSFTRYEPPDDAEVEVTGPDGRPKQEGCATIASVGPADDGAGIASVGPADDGAGIVVEINP